MLHFNKNSMRIYLQQSSIGFTDKKFLENVRKQNCGVGEIHDILIYTLYQNLITLT